MIQIDIPEGYVKIKELAQALRISSDTVNLYLANKLFSSRIKLGATYYYHIETVRQEICESMLAGKYRNYNYEKRKRKLKKEKKNEKAKL